MRLQQRGECLKAAKLSDRQWWNVTKYFYFVTVLK